MLIDPRESMICHLNAKPTSKTPYVMLLSQIKTLCAPTFLWLPGNVALQINKNKEDDLKCLTVLSHSLETGINVIAL